jgi:hypothetical protein
MDDCFISVFFFGGGRSMEIFVLNYKLISRKIQFKIYFYFLHVGILIHQVVKNKQVNK